MTLCFNPELDTDLNPILATHPDVQFHQFNVFGLFQYVEADPSAFGLTDVTDPAILAPAGTDATRTFSGTPSTRRRRPARSSATRPPWRPGATEPSSVVLILAGGAGFLGCGALLRRKRLPSLVRSCVALLAGAFLLNAPAPAQAQTDPAAPPADDAAADDATTADAGPAPADPPLQHFRLDYTWLPGENSAHGLEIDDVDGSVTLAAPLGHGLAPLLFTPGGGVHFWNAPRPAPAGAPRLANNLFDSYVEVGWRPRLAEWLFADLAVTPGVYSDFRDVGGSSFQMRGRGLAIVAFAPQFQVAAGAMYVNYNHTKLLPAGGVIWNPNDDTRLPLLFPQPKLSRRLATLADALLWGYLKGEFGGGRWSVGRPDGSHDLMDYTDARRPRRLGAGRHRGNEQSCRGRLRLQPQGYVRRRHYDYTPDATVLLRAGLAF